MLNLVDTVAMVSGAGSGIGRAIARACAARGAIVAVVDIDPARAEETVRVIAEAGGRAVAYVGDTTDLAGLEALAARIEAEHGRINAAFNNAGVFVGGTLDQTTPDDFDWLFGVNVRGTYNAVAAFLPAIRRAAAAGELALIVNTGSENCFGLPTIGAFSAYTATKHAVLGLTDALRRDLAGEAIQVALLCPGLVVTDLWDARRTRQPRFGGAYHAPAEEAALMEGGRSPEETAEAMFAGLDAGDFMIVTDPGIRSFGQVRLDEIAAAFDLCDARNQASKRA